MSGRRVAVFFPQCPWPVRSGAHRRCMDLLDGFVAMGWDVRLLSTDLFDHGRWSEESATGLAARGIRAVVHPGRDSGDHRRERWSARLARWGISERDPFADPHLCPPSLRSWFRRELEAWRPDLALVNYAWWTPLGKILAGMGIPRILEIHDLVTLNARLSDPLQRILGWEPRTPGEVSEAVFTPPAPDLEASEEEYRVLASWPVISSISAAEAVRVASACPGSRVVHVPPAVELPSRIASLDGHALFPTGPNLFNLQGIHLLAARILPRVLATRADFTIDISGHCCASVRQAPGLRPLGFVADFAGLLSGARFLVSPVRGGTGLQLKVLEGMAAGVPAVCLPGPYQEVPVADGIDGVRAESVEVFADACARLWSDVAERRRLGEAARATVAERHSRSAQLGAMRRLVAAAGLEP